MDKVTLFLSKPRHLLLAGVSALSLVSLSGLLWWYKKPILRLLRGKSKRDKKRKRPGVNVGAIFGMDVGGTLTKIVYFQAKQLNQPTAPISNPDGTSTPVPRRLSSDNLAQLDSPDHQAALQELYTYMDLSSQRSNGVMTRDDELTVYSPFLEGQLHFMHFETRNMMTAINVLSSSTVMENVKSIGCTGGGAHKYADQILEELEITLNKHDELGSLVRGMHFALTNFSEECYTYRNADAPMRGSEEHVSAENLSDLPNKDDEGVPISVKRWQKDSKEYTKKIILPVPSLATFPYLVVNIGSGVSILKVSSPGVYERVSGTSLGGGTYWGLCRLLTNCATYDDVLDIAENGDAGTVDMLVKDIYGGDYGNMLSGSMVASSFGKLVMKERPREGVAEEDLALAMLMMITNNIGQIAHLNAQLHNCNKIFFVGSFLRHNPISCRRLAFAIDFWSAGSMEALFLMHEGYFGALGTFLQSVYGEDVDKTLNDSYLSKLNEGNGAANAAAVAGSKEDAGSGEDNGTAPTGWGKNIAKIAKWSASHFGGDSAPTTSDRTPAKANKRMRSSSDDYLRYKSNLTPK